MSPPTQYTLAHSTGGYSTNVPTADLIDGKAMVALEFAGEPLTPEHGGPARLLVAPIVFFGNRRNGRFIEFTKEDVGLVSGNYALP